MPERQPSYNTHDVSYAPSYGPEDIQWAPKRGEDSRYSERKPPSIGRTATYVY